MADWIVKPSYGMKSVILTFLLVYEYGMKSSGMLC
jgi:hypothetical protein